MTDFSHAAACGTVGQDPLTGESQANKRWARFSIAVNTRWGENERTDWMSVACFGKAAEIVADRVRKGSRVSIDGTLQEYSYTAKDGTDRAGVEIVAHRVYVLNSATN